MSGIRDFIFDNVRYIISGILLIFIVIILVKCTGETDSEKEKNPEEDSVIAAEDEQQIQEPEEEPANDLVQDAYPDVNAIVSTYFKAKADGDVDALREVVSVLDDTEADSVTKMAEHIESYNNIACFTKNGPEMGSYVAYVCYDIKFVNVDTMAPSLTLLYICTAADGNLYVNNGEWDAQSESVINEFNSGSDVQALIAQVESSYNEALAQDEKLSNLASTIQSASQTPEEEEPAQTEEEPESEDETVYAKDTVNVRSQASETADRVGQIAKGDSATRISEENGWSKINYNNATAYVKSEYLTTNKDDIQQEEAAAAPNSGAAQITETARMRSGEATDSELIETLFPGTRVEIVEHRAGGRTKITYSGKTGYVNTECLGPIG